MIVQRFLRFIETAGVADRAAGASALGRAYLVSPMTDDERRLAEAAMSVLLDDPAPQVRLALAEALAASPDAPRHVVLALAADQPEIARAVLARSPVLLEAELVDFAAGGDERVQRAVAERRPLAAPIAAALAEIGSPGACAALLDNDAAEIAPFSLARVVERHGGDAVVRDLLLARPGLPVALRQRLIADLSNLLGAFAAERNWLSPERASEVARDSLDRATLALAEGCEEALPALVAHLAASGQLTPAFLLRGLCQGNRALLVEALVHLTRLPHARVAGIVEGRSPQAFQALYRRAGLPAGAYGAFQSVLDVVDATDMPDRPAGRLHHSRQILERVLTRYRGFSPDESDHLLLLLRRFAAEAAREEGRLLARSSARAPLMITDARAA